MSDIELVIKISEEDFEIMKHNIAVNNPLCPLSQEEMVAKVANGTPLDEVIDKIRAEIDSALSEEVISDNRQQISDVGIGLELALSIIDKYAESEDNIGDKLQ